jgi:SAM-dependent methyltransferase
VGLPDGSYVLNVIDRHGLLDIYGDAAMYDCENQSCPDLGFWVGLACEPDTKSFLELCCGTGRVGVHLLPHLELYHGADISGTFLESFREKAGESGGMELFEEDVRCVRTRMTYDIVAVPFNSMSHMYGLEDIQQALESAKVHMHGGSRFVFDIHNPSLALLLRDGEYERRRFVGPEGETIVYESSQFDRAQQVNHIRWRYVARGREVKSLCLPMRMFFPQEMDNHLLGSGFTIEAKYGSFGKEAFSSGSPKQIYVCRRQ